MKNEMKMKNIQSLLRVDTNFLELIQKKFASRVFLKAKLKRLPSKLTADTAVTISPTEAPIGRVTVLGGRGGRVCGGGGSKFELKLPVRWQTGGFRMIGTIGGAGIITGKALDDAASEGCEASWHCTMMATSRVACSGPLRPLAWAMTWSR